MNLRTLDTIVIETDAFQITQTEFVVRALIAIGIGFIIGLEREHAALKENQETFAGIRTFIFVVLLGFIAGLCFYLLSPLVYVGILACVVIVTAISYYITASKGDIGATTELSVLIGFLLGTLLLLGKLEISLAITVVVVVLLSAKFRLRSFVGEITAEELYDFIRFVVIALLIFPFLPNEAYGPYKVINPHEIGWVIILTSGLGFVGYLLMKFLGPRRGILISGIVGGLISSTAVTWVFSKKSRENESNSHNCAVAILAASSIMAVRVLVWTFIFNRALFNAIAGSILLVLVSAIGVTLFFYYKYRRREIIETRIRQDKPLDLPGALVFGLVYTVILLVVSYANEKMGDSGLMISSAIAGLSDIDAIAITVSKLAHDSLGFGSAGDAILVAMISNTFVKTGIGVWAGSRTLRKDLFAGYGVIIVAAIIALLFQ